jgi:hypothetical protein
MAANFLQRSRHGSVFYFRRRVPDDLRILTSQAQIFRSLHTTNRREAIVRARALATGSDRLFTQLRDMAKKEKLHRTDLKLSFELAELGTVEVEAEPHESEALNSALATLVDAAAKAKASGDARAVAQAGRESQIGRENQGKAVPCLGDAIEAYIASPHLKPTSARRFAPVLRGFKAFFGSDAKLSAITQSRFAEYAEMITANGRAADKTKTLYISTAGSFHTWCRSRYDDLPIIATKTLKPRRTTPESEDRAAFSLAELGILVDAVKPMRDSEPHKFWITALSAFTGARLEELAQLDIHKAIDQTEDGRYWYIDITEAGGGSLKTKASVRKVPLHPALIAAGFPTYVEKLRLAGETRLFPAWKPRVDRAHGGKKYGHKATRWGGNQLASLRLEGKITRSKLTYFQSMRHALINHMKQAMVEETLRCAIVGHETGGINQNRYGKQYGVTMLGDKMVEAMAGYADLLK